MRNNDLALPEGLSLRHCRLDDLNGIVRIVNSKNNRLSFGWVQKVVLADAVNHQDLEGEESQHLIRVVVNEEGSIIAFFRAYHRKDGVTSLHEIGVAEDRQGTGIGGFLLRHLIASARRRGVNILRLKTPIGMRSNGYYPRFGFKLVGTQAGRKRTLNIYELTL